MVQKIQDLKEHIVKSIFELRKIAIPTNKHTQISVFHDLLGIQVSARDFL